MAATIGIKEANGDFYSILEENSAVKKRLVLTTVHNNQKSVQIDLYKSSSKSMADAMYIGSIVVENISLKPKGDPSIEMTISSNREGSISADAVDLGNPANKHNLSVSLKSFEDDKNEYPDFEMDESQKPESLQHPRDERKFPWLPIIILGIVLILLCLGLWFFLFRDRNSPGPKAETTVSAPAQSSTSAAQSSVQTPETQTPENPPVTQTSQSPPAQTSQPAQPVVVERPPRANPQPVSRDRTAAPVYSFNVPQTIPPEGIVYKVRWGDTLWDISEAFYRNPRLYTVIVRSNEISNPNLIVSGTELTILPRN
jgi:LysM repeat protein